jgi:GDPmannose 4,6-dehydratase
VIKGKKNSFSLGNIDNVKDWGYAKDYVNGMWLMGQQEIPRDFVLATGRPKTIRHFVETVARELDIVDWRHYVKIDPEVVTRDLGVTLVGDPTEAEEMLGWNHSVSSEGLVSHELGDSLD